VLLDDFPPWFLRVFALALGLIWGSFLNVVIYRVPRGMSVVRPASHCPACGKPIRAFHNIPVLGLPLAARQGRLLRRQALSALSARRGPGRRALARHPRGDHPAPRAHDVSIERALAIYTADFALCARPRRRGLHRSRAHGPARRITLGGTVLGLATFSFRDLAFTDALLGAAVGFGIIWLPFVVIYPKIRGRVGMGLGDAKLLMLAGAWFGWSGALFVLGAGAVQGTIAAIVTLLFGGKLDEPEAVRREREELKKEMESLSPEERAELEKELAHDPLAEEAGEGLGQARIAFGPFLILATLEQLLLGRNVLDLYLDWVDRA
jgi:leader peptidase (prepilin peptidase)/N-methyltransferase